MSIQGISTPSSTTGSTADSPAASQPPPTPVSPAFTAPSTPPAENQSADVKQEPQQQPASTGPTKRKPSRRANTAERRATHNAVERQRRETLNGRFLDLAALLPNLATVRRPSKSAIVNSSIALIHSQRRQRLIAARELRLLKLESDALRRELNEWRDRSGLPRVDEPPRNAEFMSLLGLGEGEGDGWWDPESIDEMGEEEKRAYALVMGAVQEEDEDGYEGVEEDDLARGMSRQPSVYNQGEAVNLQHIMPRQNMVRGPAIASPTNIAFDQASHLGFPGGGNAMFEPNGHPHPLSHSLPVHPNFNNVMNFGNDIAAEKVAAWNTQMYNQLPPGQQNMTQNQWAQQQQQQNAQHGMYTPPGTGGGVSNGTASPQQQIANPFSQQNQQFIPNLPQQHMAGQNIFPDADDASSVHSVGSHDGSGRSVGGSPQPLGPAYEVNNAGMIRRPNLSVAVPSVNPQWNAQAQPQQIAAGGGGGRHFNAMNMFM